MKIFAFPKHWCQMAYITASLLRTPTNRTNHFNCMAMRYSRKNNKKNKRNREDGNKGNRGNPKRLAVQHKFTQWVAYSFSSRWSHGLYQEWFNSFPGTSNEFYQHPQGFKIQADRQTHTYRTNNFTTIFLLLAATSFSKLKRISTWIFFLIEFEVSKWRISIGLFVTSEMLLFFSTLIVCKYNRKCVQNHLANVIAHSNHYHIVWIRIFSGIFFILSHAIAVKP